MNHRDILRRMLATLVFRIRHAIKDMPVGFEDFEAGMDVRTPEQILNHVYGMLVATDQLYRGKKPTRSEPLPWMEAVEAFHSALARLDHSLAEAEPPDDDTVLRLFQGPFCDAMTHVGQLMVLRRLFGFAVPGANYYRADIQTGRLGSDQALPQ
jgi:hypothetical protein